ncbi:fibrous sheath CABYR-binding protein-like isoform X1 [Macrobrachium rosenbergii]|uniref:fibrous sheath CABYR-binding protein-like isoform X1 n=1 Tax=Macrobrachium rosenbergii TaxID=79674 RepID=UPI0034D5886E
MAGDEEKKKKKKSKKGEKAEKSDEAPAGGEEAPPPEPEPEPAPPAPEEAPQEEAPPEAPAADAAPPAEGAPAAEAPAEGEEALEPPPAPKKKPKFFVHWNRKKARFYDYNWDYGGNYYSSLVRYIDVRAGDYPRRMAFAERGIRSNVQRKTIPDTRTTVLLDDVRRSIRNFELSQKTYMK